MAKIKSRSIYPAKKPSSTNTSVPPYSASNPVKQEASLPIDAPPVSTNRKGPFSFLSSSSNSGQPEATKPFVDARTDRNDSISSPSTLGVGSDIHPVCENGSEEMQRKRPLPGTPESEHELVESGNKRRETNHYDAEVTFEFKGFEITFLAEAPQSGDGFDSSSDGPHIIRGRGDFTDLNGEENGEDQAEQGRCQQGGSSPNLANPGALPAVTATCSASKATTVHHGVIEAGENMFNSGMGYRERSLDPYTGHWVPIHWLRFAQMDNGFWTPVCMSGALPEGTTPPWQLPRPWVNEESEPQVPGPYNGPFSSRQGSGLTLNGEYASQQHVPWTSTFEEQFNMLSIAQTGPDKSPSPLQASQWWRASLSGEKHHSGLTASSQTESPVLNEKKLELFGSDYDEEEALERAIAESLDSKPSPSSPTTG